jgi:hypothetical protein
MVVLLSRILVIELPTPPCIDTAAIAAKLPRMIAGYYTGRDESIPLSRKTGSQEIIEAGACGGSRGWV